MGPAQTFVPRAWASGQSGDWDPGFWVGVSLARQAGGPWQRREALGAGARPSPQKDHRPLWLQVEAEAMQGWLPGSRPLSVCPW